MPDQEETKEEFQAYKETETPKSGKKLPFKLNPKPEKSLWEQQWIVFKIAMPQVLTTMGFQLTNLTTMYFIGHNTNSVTMAGMGMGHVVYNACSVAFCFGLNGTLESKCS